MRFIRTASGAGHTGFILGGRYKFEKGVLEIPDDNAELITNLTKVLRESYETFPEHEVLEGKHGYVKGFFEGHTEGGPDGPADLTEGSKRPKK